MALDTIVNRIIEKKYFKNNYNKLLVYSVSSQFLALNPQDLSQSIDWKYLISCASILSKDSRGQILDIAYRICQAVLCEECLPVEYHNACAAMLNLLTNSPAINLAIEREYISKDYISHIPMNYAMDVKRKEFSNTINDGEKVIFLNDFQKAVYDTFNNTRALSISAPTSAGKSFIMMQLIKNFIGTHSFAKIAYIVPTRALIQQVEMDVRNLIKSSTISADVSSIPVKPAMWKDLPCIMVFTQERLQWLISENPSMEFDLIIVDEAQKVGDGSRGVLLQQVLQQIAQNQSTQFIFASPMSENPSSLLKLVNYSEDVGNQNKQIISEIPTVNQNLIWVSKSSNKTTDWTLDLLSNGDKIKLGNIKTSRIPQVGMRLPVLSFVLASEKGNLVYCNGAAEAEKIAIQLTSLIKNKTPDYCVSQRIKDLIKLVKKTVHPNYTLSEVLQAGVAFHYGNMPLGIRNEIEELFKLGEITFLVCTSTLVEGVNLPAKTIFMRGPKKGVNTPMNEMDFWNLAGRAGRQGKEFQGNIICLDATDDNAWKNGVPSERKKYYIKSAMDEIIEFHIDELLRYIEKTDETTNSDSRIDYAYTYFLSNYFTHGSISDSPSCRIYGQEVCEALDKAFSTILSKVEIPPEILSKNQGVNPIAQQKLLEYFRSENKDIEELIPPFPEDDDAREKYMHIIGRISTYITKEPYQLNFSRSILITNWMRGYGLARIISDNINWNREKGTGKNLAAIIRDTMREIEEFARFKFLKYTTCYLDVLKYYLISCDKGELIKDIPQISLWLEFGASQETQISLMSMGFTRMTALELSMLMVDTEMDKEKCIAWFKNNDVHSMDISPTLLLEIDRILELQ